MLVAGVVRRNSDGTTFGSVVFPPLVGGLKVEMHVPTGSVGETVITAPGLCYVIDGTFEVGLDGNRGIARPGTLIAFPPGPRQVRAHAGGRVVLVGLRDGDFRGRFAAEASFLSLDRRRMREWDERIRQLVGTTTDAERIEAVTAATALRLDAAEARARNHFELVESVVAYLAASLDRAATLRELSDHFGFAPNYLNDLVSMSTGRSIRQWTIALRLEAARLALRRRTESVTAVATTFGFEPAYFARRFAARYRLSPAAWRTVVSAAPATLDVVNDHVLPHGVRALPPTL